MYAWLGTVSSGSCHELVFFCIAMRVFSDGGGDCGFEFATLSFLLGDELGLELRIRLLGLLRVRGRDT